MNKDYETIEDPSISDETFKTYVTVQELTSQIQTIRFNYILNLEAVIAYKKLVGLDTENLENDVKDLKQRVKELENMKKEWQKRIA